jgi:hypothetical protein
MLIGSTAVDRSAGAESRVLGFSAAKSGAQR